MLCPSCCRSSDHSRAKYEGDVSAWGRKTIPGFYDKRRAGDSESDFTMSSGLSPRDGEAHRPFDVEEAKNVSASERLCGASEPDCGVAPKPRAPPAPSAFIPFTLSPLLYLG